MHSKCSEWGLTERLRVGNLQHKSALDSCQVISDGLCLPVQKDWGLNALVDDQQIVGRHNACQVKALCTGGGRHAPVFNVQCKKTGERYHMWHPTVCFVDRCHIYPSILHESVWDLTTNADHLVCHL